MVQHGTQGCTYVVVRALMCFEMRRRYIPLAALCAGIPARGEHKDVELRLLE